jgi:hypothetical protein
MKSKPEQEEAVEFPEVDFSKTHVLVDDYKDLEIEMIAGSRGKTLGWNKYAVDKRKGFND